MSLNSSANTSSAETIRDFEIASLDSQDFLDFFQDLIDSGQAWQMQGRYGCTAMTMIRNGHCLLGPIGYQDIYGNYIPSRDEVQPGTPGSTEFVLNCLAG